MFGYVRIYKPELRMREYEQYRGVYCSLCKHLGSRYGAALRLTLSYDMTFLALLTMALKTEGVGFCKSRCTYNPVKRCLACSDAETLDKTADTAALLSYYQCLDTLDDERFFHSLKARLMLPFLRRYHRKAKKRQPALDAVIAEMMQKQAAVEAVKTASLDAAAEPFAAFMQALFSPLGAGAQQTVLARFGYCLGRYIYLADAAEDMGEDGRRGRYNPFVLSRSVNVNDPAAVAACRQYAGEVLRSCQAECIAAYDLLEIRRFDGILKNILECGVSDTLSRILSDERPRKDKR